MPMSPRILRDLRLAYLLRSDPLRLAMEMGRQGDLVEFRLGPYRAHVVNHPAGVREVLSTKHRFFRKLPRIMNVLRQLDGEGLAVSEGEFWKGQRKRMRPVIQRLEGSATAITGATRAMLSGWRDGDTIDLADAASCLMMDIFHRLFHGVPASPERASSLCGAINSLSRTLVVEMGRIFPLTLLPRPGSARKLQAIRELGSFCRESNTKPAAGLFRGHPATLTMPPEQTCDEAATLLHAGHETTAAALAWIGYRLAIHPDVAARVFREIDRMLGTRTPAAEDVRSFAYTSCVVQETLRLHVPTWTLFPREAVHDVEICGRRIPAGSWVFIFPYALHRNPRWFDDPEMFDPERFSPGWRRVIPRFAYIPFGAGPHRCVGNRFAMLTLALVTAMIGARFRLELVRPDQRIEAEPFLALRPKGRLPVRVFAR